MLAIHFIVFLSELPAAMAAPPRPLPGARSASGLVITTIFISNLHCPTCVDSIQQSLSALDPVPELISHSIISHSVVLRHPPGLSASRIAEVLEAAAFEIHSIFQDRPAASGPVEFSGGQPSGPHWQNSLEQSVSRWHHPRDQASQGPDALKMKRHVEQCEQCKVEAESKERPDSEDDAQLPYHAPRRSDQTSLEDNKSRPSTSNNFAVVDQAASNALRKASLSISGMTCGSCVGTITYALKRLPWVRSADVNLLTHSAAIVFDGDHSVNELLDAIKQDNYEASVEQITELASSTPTKAPAQESEQWQATYAIGGMTCSSCVANISNALKSYPWVENADVNLLSHSAVVTFTGREHLPEITGSIEYAGYEAALDSIHPKASCTEKAQERIMAIRIDGMYCHHCPGRVVNALNSKFTDRSALELQGFLSQEDPILRLRYIPRSPDFTIRHILKAIDETDAAFRPSIYHPPTIEDRALEMHNRERRRLLLRLAFSFVVAIPTFIIGIVYMGLVQPSNPGRRCLTRHSPVGNVSEGEWLLFGLATPVYFRAADVFHARAWKEIKAMWRPGSRTPLLQRFTRFGSMNMLMSLGTSIAYFASIAELVLAATKTSSGSMENSYFDSVVFLTMFILAGRFLEAWSKGKTGDAVTSLGKLRPEEAMLVSSAGDEKIATELLELGDIVRVPYGASPPFDGTLIEGETRFDDSSLTGESRPVVKASGDTLYSGTINKGGSIQVRITSVSGTSMLDQIINVVREGQTRRAPVERIADVITSHFVPIITLLALITWLVWLAVGENGWIPSSWREDQSGGWALWSLRFAIAVFVIACPCGIGLAAPTALFVGSGLAAKHGILARGGGEAFEVATTIDCVVFDKTGTLTKGGDPTVTDHEVLGGHDQEVVFGLVKALEESSTHPIASAIVGFCASQCHKMPAIINIDEIPGKGLKGTFTISTLDTPVTALIGNEALMTDHNIAIPLSTYAVLESWKSQGKSVALSAMLLPDPSVAETDAPSAWILSAVFSISDSLRPDAAVTVAALQQRGLDVWMLTGDNPATARAVGSLVGIAPANIIAGVLPEQKAEKIKYLQRSLPPRQTPRSRLFGVFRNSPPRRRATVAMLGDGINDAPALSTADLSIAIGSGSHIALTSSSFILLTSHLPTLLTLLTLSRAVLSRVRFNFVWALIYNVLAVPLAAGAFYAIRMGDGGHVKLPPVYASIAMAASSVSVVTSSLVLRSRIPWLGFRGGDLGSRRTEEVTSD